MNRPDTPFPRHWLYYIVLKDRGDRRCGGAGPEVLRFVVMAMAQSMPGPSLRPFLAEDTPVLAAIFVASIEALTGDDYSEAQQEAWIAAIDDEAAFGKRLASQLTLVATIEGAPVGFASLRGNDHIDLLYVHPNAIGQGVAASLCEALEKLANARGAKSLTVEASDNAAEFFAHRGYEARQRNTVSVHGEWLANTTMQKPLGDAKPGDPA